jgi:GT2 family glycosyltransferase
MSTREGSAARMAARVVQVDLSQPLPAIRTDGPYARYGMLWILVKFGVQPLGWVKCRAKQYGHVITPDLLAGLICDTMWLQVHDAARLRTFERTRSPHAPGISVVVCTREHPDVLERQLASLAQLKYPDFEIIVVDNAPKTDGTRRVCEKFPFVRRVLEPRPGLDYARNTGWQVARKEIIAYTDDDAIVDPHWLTALGDNYADPQVHCVTGVTFPLELETPAQLHFEKYGGMQRGFHRRVYKPGTWNTFFPLGSGRFGAGVNLSLRRATLEKMGGFDPALDVGSLGRGGGDLDIMTRVLRDGGCLVYDPRAICFHQHRRTMKQLRKQMFDYGWGFTAFCAKYAHDLELGNLSMAMLKRWSKKWGWRRLKENLKLALLRRPHFPVQLILLEIFGGICGLPAYRRSVRKVKSDAIKFRNRGIIKPTPIAPREIMEAIAAAARAAATKVAASESPSAPADAGAGAEPRGKAAA